MENRVLGPSYVLQTTADGSPTLSLGENGEWMHHRQSAFEETLYVYGEAVARGRQLRYAPTYVSVGVGLGYVEMLLAASLWRAKPEGVRIRSFEADPRLTAALLAWVEGDSALCAPWSGAYDLIADRTARHFDVPPSTLKAVLRTLREEGEWTVEGPLRESTAWPQRFETILYDAFSAETAPQLWTAEFLSGLLSQAAAPRCVFATYAATGDLKRTLAAARFRDQKRPGYCGKRECTLAVRP